MSMEQTFLDGAGLVGSKPVVFNNVKSKKSSIKPTSPVYDTIDKLGKEIEKMSKYIIQLEDRVRENQKSGLQKKEIISLNSKLKEQQKLTSHLKAENVELKKELFEVCLALKQNNSLHDMISMKQSKRKKEVNLIKDQLIEEKTLVIDLKTENEDLKETLIILQTTLKDAFAHRFELENELADTNKALNQNSFVRDQTCNQLIDEKSNSKLNSEFTYFGTSTNKRLRAQLEQEKQEKLKLIQDKDNTLSEAMIKLIDMKAELEQEKLRNQGILLRGIENCSDATRKGVSLLWTTRSVTIFLYFNKQRVLPFKSLSSNSFVVNTL